MAFDVGSIKAHLELDRTKFNTELQEAKASAREFAQGSYEATLGLNLTRFYKDLAEARRSLESISDEKVKIDGDLSGLKAAETQARGILKSISDEKVKIDGDLTGLKASQVQAKAISQSIASQKPTVTIDANASPFTRTATRVRAQSTAIGRMRPNVLVGIIHDPFMTGFKMIWSRITQLRSARPNVHVRSNAREVGHDHNFLQRAILRSTDGFARFWPMATGRDGTKWRWLGRIGSAIAGIGSSALRAVAPLASAGGGIGGIGTAATRAGGGMGGFALSIASTGVSALITASALGILLAMIMPILAMLTLGLATIAAVGVGLGLMGAAGALAAKDFGLLREAQRKVENAQIKLNSARKAAAGEARKLKPLEDALTKAEDEQTAAKKRLSKAYDNLSDLRGKGGPQTKQITTLERKLSEEYKSLRITQNGIATVQNQLARARANGQQAKVINLEKKLELGYEALGQRQHDVQLYTGRLDKLRDGKASASAKKIEAAEKELAKAQGQVETKTRAVESAQKKLNAARKSGSSERVQQAEKELAAAQNEQAVALRKAARGSASYEKNLKELHKEVNGLGPAFRKSFGPAAARITGMAADVVSFTKQKLPALGKAADQSAKQFEKGYRDAGTEGNRFDKMLRKIPPVMRNLGSLSNTWGKIFNSFMNIALPHVKDFTKWAEKASKRLLNWMDSEKGRKEIKKFLDLAVPLAKSLGKFFKKVGGELFELAKEHGPNVVDAINFMTDAVEFLIEALDLALEVAERLVNVIQWIRRHNQTTSGPNHVTSGIHAPGAGKKRKDRFAEGGDFQAMAQGGSVPLFRAAHGLSNVGAHFVEDPSLMDVGGSRVLYGEALSGGHREYAFPLDGGWRFITEQPGFDANSFNLWRDLGDRKGFLKNLAMNVKATKPHPQLSPRLGAEATRTTRAPAGRVPGSSTIHVPINIHLHRDLDDAEQKTITLIKKTFRELKSTSGSSTQTYGEAI